MRSDRRLYSRGLPLACGPAPPRAAPSDGRGRSRSQCIIGRATIGPPYVILRALDDFLGDAVFDDLAYRPSQEAGIGVIPRL
jgi:hypothetical protein